MAGNPLQSRVEAIRRLTRKSAGPALRRALSRSRPEDIAGALSHLAPAEQRLLLSHVEDDQQASDVLVQLDDNELNRLVHVLDFQRLVRLFQKMEADDAADLIARLPEDFKPRILAAIKGEEKEQVEDLLAWPEDSAGRIMQPVAFRVSESHTCRESIEALQLAENIEMVFYLYAENDAGQLVGVTSLRNLLTHSPSTRVSDIMTPDVIAVTPETDQEEVARIVGRYGLLAVPVVDAGRRLLGIVTVDDVVHVIKEEAAEDMLLMAGVGDEVDAAHGTVLQATRTRLPWLFVTMCGGMITSELIHQAPPRLGAETVLVAFIPVVMGMGGNVGIQAATIAVRNLATGQAVTQGIGPTLFREVRVGMLVGIAFAVVVGGFAAVRNGDPMLGLAIATAGLLQLSAAATFGTLVPAIMNRIGVDPAVATGPFVTTGLDMIGITIYVSTCILVLNL